MRQHQTLTVTGSSDAITRVRARIVAQVTGPSAGPWSHDATREAQLTRMGGDSSYLCLGFAGGAGARPASVVLYVKDTELSLANLFPEGGNDLEDAALVDVCNAVVVRVHHDLLAPAAAAEGAHVDLGPDDPGLADWMTAETAARLRSFAGAANKATGIGHPNDRGRFLDFVLAAHAEGAALTAEDLQGWLREEKFPARNADQIAEFYEFGRALLARSEARGSARAAEHRS